MPVAEKISFESRIQSRPVRWLSRVKVLATRYHDLNLIPRTPWWKDKTDSYKVVF